MADLVERVARAMDGAESPEEAAKVAIYTVALALLNPSELLLAHAGRGSKRLTPGVVHRVLDSAVEWFLYERGLDINAAFIWQWESDVREAFLRQEELLRANARLQAASADD